MSHFAKVVDGKVTQVIVAEAEFFDTFVDTSPGAWIQTSYNTQGNQHPEGRPLRGNYAGIGYTYDAANDVFYGASPFPSWVLSQTTWLWEAPIAKPDDGKQYDWNETTHAWDEVPNIASTPIGTAP
jgi:hypothetical protein